MMLPWAGAPMGHRAPVAGTPALGRVSKRSFASSSVPMSASEQRASSASHESESKPGTKMVDPEPCFKDEEGAIPQLFMPRGLSLTFTFPVLMTHRQFPGGAGHVFQAIPLRLQTRIRIPFGPEGFHFPNGLPAHGTKRVWIVWFKTREP